VASAATVHATRVQVQIVQQVVHTVTVTHVRRPAHLQIVPIVRHVRTATDQNVAMTVVHQVIVQRVVHTVTEIHAQVPIVQIVHPVHTEIAILVRAHVRLPIDQRVARMAIVIHARHRAQVLIAENAVTVHAIPVQVLIVPIVHHGRTVTDQNVVTIVVHQVIVQPVVHTVTATHDQAHAQLQIVHVEITHSVAIVRKQAMIDVPQVAPTVHVTIVHHAMIVAVRVTANAVVVPIVPEVTSPMIAKSVHAVALAKSA
jgi:hypothetical protein